MEAVLGLIGVVVGIVMIVTFFNMSTKLTQIKDGIYLLVKNAVDTTSPNYWAEEYRKEKLKGDKSKSAEALKLFVYYKIKKVDLPNKKEEFDQLKERYTEAFLDLGGEYPAWDDKIFK